MFVFCISCVHSESRQQERAQKLCSALTANPATDRPEPTWLTKSVWLADGLSLTDGLTNWPTDSTRLIDSACLTEFSGLLV